MQHTHLQCNRSARSLLLWFSEVVFGIVATFVQTFGIAQQVLSRARSTLVGEAGVLGWLLFGNRNKDDIMTYKGDCASQKHDASPALLELIIQQDRSKAWCIDMGHWLSSQSHRGSPTVPAHQWVSLDLTRLHYMKDERKSVFFFQKNKEHWKLRLDLVAGLGRNCNQFCLRIES